MARYFDPTEDAEMQRQAERMRAYETFKAMATPDTAANIGSLARTYPGMKPGTALALGKSNVTAESALAKAAAKAEAKRGFGWHSIGDVVSGAVGGATRAVGKVKDEVYGAAKGTLRGAFIGLDAIGQTTQGTVRGAVRDGFDLSDVTEGFKQSDLYQGHREIQREGGYGGLLTGRTDVNFGSGFFAGGDVRSEGVRVRRAAAPLIDGKAVTLGRHTASQVFEPGTKPYGLLSGLIDLGVVVGTDPTTFLAAPIKAGIQASKLIGPGGGALKEVVPLAAKQVARAGEQERLQAGLVDGIRKTILPENAADYLNSRKGVRVRQYLVAETNFEKLRKALGPEVDVTLIPKLQDAKSDAEVLDILAPALELGEIRSKLGVSKSALLQAEEAPLGIARASVVKAKEQVRSYRWTQKMSSAVSDLDNPNALVEDMYRQGRNVLMDDDTIAQFTEKAARATDRTGRYAAVDEMLDHIQKVVLVERAEKRGKFTQTLEPLTRQRDELKAKIREMEKAEKARIDAGEVGGMGPRDLEEMQKRLSDVQAEITKTRELRGEDLAVAKKLTQWRKNSVESMRAYATDDIGQNAKVPGAVIDGKMTPVPTPHYVVETINQQFHWPDAQDLRRATSGLMDMLDKVPHGLGRAVFLNGTALADFTTSQIFKVGALFRAAYPLRVLGEEQARLPGAGLTSIYTHPIRHINAMVAMKKGQITDALGNPVKTLEDFQDAMSRHANINPRTSGVVKAQGRTPYERAADPDAHAAALLDEMAKAHRDPVMSRVMNGLGDGDLHPNTQLGGIDAVKDWFWEGTGKTHRHLLGNAPSREGAVPREVWANRKTWDEDPLHSADGYIDSLVERYTTVTKGDAFLREVMATGKIDGQALSVVGKNGNRQANPAALKALKKYLDENPQAGQDTVWGDIFLRGKLTPGAAIGEKYNSFVDFMFDKGMGIPTDVMSRSQAWAQFYWKRQAELFSYMDPQLQQATLDMARANKLVSARYLKQMEKDLAQGRAGKLTAVEADTLAKAWALESSKKLMYDLSERGQFMDIYRNFFPFGEAWKEVLTTWSKITVENPTVIRRGAQLVTAGRNGDADGDGEGFFHTDPQTGEEVFTFPFSGWFNEKLTGIPAPMTAPVTGLNLFSSSILPGFGPVASVPLGKILPNRPDYDGVREALMPFGEKDMSGGVLESFLPAWFQKARVWLDKDSPEQDKAFVKTWHDTMRYLASTGEYGSSPEEQQRLLDDSNQAARRVFGVRGLAQFFAPSPPSPKFVTMDKDGNAMLSILMVKEYRKLQDEDYKTATAKFIERFGENAFLTTISKTEGGGDPSDLAYNFVRENPEAVRRHKDVYGFFLPQQEEFSQKSYQYQQREGERKLITPEEALEIGNQRVASMIYRQAKSQFDDTPTAKQRVWLAGLRDELKKEYPGYDPTPRNLADQKILISKLIRAAGDPVLSQTKAGQGLTEYLVARDQALAIARERGRVGFEGSKDTADLRKALRAEAERIGSTNPDFMELFDRTFNREMKADEDDNAETVMT